MKAETTTEAASNAQTSNSPSSLDAYARIASAAQSAASREETLIKAFHIAAKAFDSPYAMLYVRDGGFVIEESRHSGSTDPNFWRRPLERFLTDCLSAGQSRARLLNPKRGATKVAFLATPVLSAGGAPIGATALVVAHDGESDVARKLATLESLSAFATSISNASAPRRAGSAAPNEAWSHAGDFATPEQLAFAITNNLRNKMGCEQVGLGLVTRRHVRILSVSGLDRIVKRSAGIEHLQAAMEECLDADEIISHHSATTWSPEDGSRRYRLHLQWRTAAKGDAVASIPLHAEGRVVAILTIRRRGSEAIEKTQLEEVRKRVEPFAPALILTQRAARSLVAHSTDRVVDAMRVLTHRGHLARKAATIVMVACAAWFVFGTMMYQVMVPCAIAAAESRHVAAPFEGVLESVAVTAGDHVTRGQTLCRLDSRDLERARTEILAQMAVLEREKDRAMGEKSPVDFQLALANQRLARTRFDMLESRINRANVVSPIDGVVIAGDLRRRVSAVLVKGEPLFEVAPLSSRILELSIPERDVDDIEVGMGGFFAPHARPEHRQAFQITRIKPHALIHRESNVYHAEADTELSDEWMLPGTEGIAKVQVGRRAVWQVVLHRMIDYVRVTLWL